ncbi:hypothetical protein ACFY00_05440 [Kitasatospora sp. NPDC001540]|uniref:hypothetical protein n=1 Tax=Kitasatospora sp. NPDC001540 TaxID=3364014 RepID=UPI0036BC07B2
MNSLPIPGEFHVQAGGDAVVRARKPIAAVTRSRAVPLSESALSDVMLCASELIRMRCCTRAAIAGYGLEWTGRLLRIEGRDRSLRLPVVCGSDYEKGSGQGLTLVNALAYSWGWEPLELGKIVFFLVATDAALTGDRRLGALVHPARTVAEADDSETTEPESGVVAAA